MREKYWEEISVEAKFLFAFRVLYTIGVIYIIDLSWNASETFLFLLENKIRSEENGLLELCEAAVIYAQFYKAKLYPIRADITLGLVSIRKHIIMNIAFPREGGVCVLPI